MPACRVILLNQICRVERAGGEEHRLAVWWDHRGRRLTEVMRWPDWFAARVGAAPKLSDHTGIEIAVTTIADWPTPVIRRRWTEADVMYAQFNWPRSPQLAHRSEQPPVELTGLPALCLLSDLLYCSRTEPLSLVCLGRRRMTGARECQQEYEALVRLYREAAERDQNTPVLGGDSYAERI